MKVLFRVDSGQRVGLGHLKRCRSLVAALEMRGIESLFLSNRNGSAGSADGLKEEETLEGVASWSVEDAEATAAVALLRRCQSILVDSHEVAAPYLASLRKAGLFVIARDDLAAYPFPCQLVFNGNADAKQLRYSSSSGDTRFLSGPEYAVLPPDFWRPFPVRDARQTPRNLLVVLGGGDAGGAMPRLLSLLDELPGEFTIMAVLGPFFSNSAEVNKAVAGASHSVKVVSSPDSLWDLMLQADLAVSAAGQTLYELARTGCPTVAVRVAANQEGQLRAFAAAGTLLPGGSMEKDGDFSEVREGVSRLLADPLKREAMSAAGRALIDGAGAGRVAETISQEVTQLASA